MSYFTAIPGPVDSTTSLTNGRFVPHIFLNTSLSITQRYNGQMGEPQVLILVKIDHKCSKFPFVSDFMAISGSVESLVDGLYVSDMVLNAPLSITKIKIRFELLMNQ